jgi:hypothetical protein
MTVLEAGYLVETAIILFALGALGVAWFARKREEKSVDAHQASAKG